MEKLNIKKSKSFALDIISKIEPMDKRNFLAVHSKKVGLTAKLIADKLKIKSNIFVTAGWLHDIGNLKNSEKHAEYSIKLLQEAGFEIGDILYDCILNHGCGKRALTAEGKIFQLADKLSIFDIDTIKIFLEQGGLPMDKEHFDFVKMMSSEALTLLEKY